MKRQLMLSAVCFLIGSSAALAQDQNNKFVVLFPLGKATLDSAAHATISQAKQEYDRSGSAHITIVGHTDTSGPADYNQKLSVKRANVVVEALVDMGARRAALHASGVGETDLAVETGDNVKEAKNRRTVITLQP